MGLVWWGCGNCFGEVVEIGYKRKEPRVPFEPPTPMKMVYNYFTELVINQSYKIGGSKGT